MEKIIQFQKNAEVIDEKGSQIGVLERVVMDPNSKSIVGLVVRSGTLFKREEKVIPLDDILATATELVILRGEHKVEDFPVFEEEHVVANEESINPEQPPVIYGYGGTPILIPNPKEQLVRVSEQNIPEGTVAMKEGAKVIAAEGRHVGQVECVLADPKDVQVTHLLVSSGLLTKETNLVPIQWVETINEDEVHLGVKKEFIEDMENIELA